MSDVTDQLLQHYSEIADKFAPQVVDAAKAAATMEAYSCLAGSLLWFLVAGIAGYAAYRFKKTDDDDWMPAVIIFGVLSVLISLPGFWAWADPWTWTTIYHPELWIAKTSLHL
jgi:hypothetical protein